jgi:hypothetical protein
MGSLGLAFLAVRRHDISKDWLPIWNLDGRRDFLPGG